jgi:hypothetical protein
MKYLYLTSCYGYNWENIKNWIVSFREVNNKDDVLIVTYTAFDQNTIEKLKHYNIKFVYEQNNMFKRIVVERFKSYSKLLDKIKYDFVYLFDLGDIIFQKNPNEWVESKLGNKKIIAGSECIRYKDEKWAENDFKQSYGYFFDFMKNKPTFNAGSFAGISDKIKDLCMNIYAMSQQHQYFAPDQAAFNFLIQTAYKDEVFYAKFEDEWCCQCGTSLDPTKMNIEPYNFSKFVLESSPKFENGLVTNHLNNKFYIVHQYNRVPEINQYYKLKYKNL